MRDAPKAGLKMYFVTKAPPKPPCTDHRAGISHSFFSQPPCDSYSVCHALARPREPRLVASPRKSQDTALYYPRERHLAITPIPRQCDRSRQERRSVSHRREVGGGGGE